MLRKILTKLGLVNQPVWEIYDLLMSDKFKVDYVSSYCVSGIFENNVDWWTISLLIYETCDSEFRVGTEDTYFRTLSWVERKVLLSVIKKQNKVYTRQLKTKLKLESEEFANKLKEITDGGK